MNFLIPNAMGLDRIELLMKIENTFGIEIPDREAEQILTVADFHNTVWQHLSGWYSDKCKSQLLFYKLRRSFANTFGFSLSNFRLNASPKELFPKNEQRQLYFDLFQRIN